MKCRQVLQDPSLVSDVVVHRIFEIKRDAGSAWHDKYSNVMPDILYQNCCHDGKMGWMAMVKSPDGHNVFEMRSCHGSPLRRARVATQSSAKPLSTK